MPRILFTALQLALVAGIILVGFSIVQKQRSIETSALSDSPAVVTPAPVQQPHERPKPFAHYQVIARRDLFRTPKNEIPAPAAIDVDALKPTELKLKLWGTITGEDGMTRAVIEDQGKRRQALYRAGEEVSTAKVKLILREKVILSVKGEDQILEIEKPSSTGKAREPGRATRAPGGTAASMAARASAPQTQGRRRAVRLKLSRLGPISEDPEEWSNYATAAPFKGEDGSSGVMVKQITPSSPLRRLGIRNGDVILDINDQQVSELGTIFQALVEVSAGEEMSVKIKRRGRERTLDYKFE